MTEVVGIRSTAAIDSAITQSRAQIAALQDRRDKLEQAMSFAPDDELQPLTKEYAEIPGRLKAAEIRITRLQAERAVALRPEALATYRACNEAYHAILLRLKAEDDKIAEAYRLIEDANKVKQALRDDQLNPARDRRQAAADRANEIGLGGEVNAMYSTLTPIEGYY